MSLFIFHLPTPKLSWSSFQITFSTIYLYPYYYPCSLVIKSTHLHMSPGLELNPELLSKHFQLQIDYKELPLFKTIPYYTPCSLCSLGIINLVMYPPRHEPQPRAEPWPHPRDLRHRRTSAECCLSWTGHWHPLRGRSAVSRYLDRKLRITIILDVIFFWDDDKYFCRHEIDK